MLSRYFRFYGGGKGGSHSRQNTCTLRMYFLFLLTFAKLDAHTLLESCSSRFRLPHIRTCIPGMRPYKTRGTRDRRNTPSLEILSFDEKSSISQLLLTLLEPQSRSGDKPVKFQVVLSPNGTAVLKGLTAPTCVEFAHKKNEMQSQRPDPIKGRCYRDSSISRISKFFVSRNFLSFRCFCFFP